MSHPPAGPASGETEEQSELAESAKGTVTSGKSVLTSVLHPGTVATLGLAAVVLLVIAAVVVLVSVGGDDQHRHAQPSPPAHPSGNAAVNSTPTSTVPAGETDSSGRKVVRLLDHPLMSDPNAGLPNLRCELPEWQSDRDSAKRYFRAAAKCLDAAWKPLLRSFDLPFTPPRLYFPSGSEFDSDCGTIQVGIETAAYYCEGELFLPYNGLQTDQYGDKSGVYLSLIAHEYGHHVQELVGIMDAAWQRIYQSGEDSREGQEMSRRKELQAQCFSGMFLGSHVDRGGSINRDVYEEAWEDQATRGDNTSGGHDHGNNKNYAKWWREGAMDNRIVDCDTFKAGVDEVR